MNDVHVVPRFDELADSGILKASIREHGGNVRVKLTSNMEEDSGILAARERHAHVAIVVLIPVHDSCLGYHDLSIERKRL